MKNKSGQSTELGDKGDNGSREEYNGRRLKKLGNMVRTLQQDG